MIDHSSYILIHQSEFLISSTLFCISSFVIVREKEKKKITDKRDIKTYAFSFLIHLARISFRCRE